MIIRTTLIDKIRKAWTDVCEEDKRLDQTPHLRHVRWTMLPPPSDATHSEHCTGGTTVSFPSTRFVSGKTITRPSLNANYSTCTHAKNILDQLESKYCQMPMLSRSKINPVLAQFRKEFKLPDEDFVASTISFHNSTHHSFHCLIRPQPWNAVCHQ